MMIHTCRYKQSANSEVHNTNDEILIPVSTNIPIVLYRTSPVLLKTLTKTWISFIDVAYIQNQIDRLRQEMEKNIAGNSEFKNLIKKKLSWGNCSRNAVHERDIQKRMEGSKNDKMTNTNKTSASSMLLKLHHQ